jgi:hypothetical protein
MASLATAKCLAFLLEAQRSDALYEQLVRELADSDGANSAAHNQDAVNCFVSAAISRFSSQRFAVTWAVCAMRSGPSKSI